MSSFRWAAATIVAGLLVMPGAVNAQQTTDSQTTATSTVPAADMAFAETATGSGKAEVELGKLATQKASDQSVKMFGQRMVDDHSKADDQLMKIALTKKIDLPTDVTKEQLKSMSEYKKGAAGYEAYPTDKPISGNPQ